MLQLKVKLKALFQLPLSHFWCSFSRPNTFRELCRQKSTRGATTRDSAHYALHTFSIPCFLTGVAESMIQQFLNFCTGIIWQHRVISGIRKHKNNCEYNLEGFLSFYYVHRRDSNNMDSAQETDSQVLPLNSKLYNLKMSYCTVSNTEMWHDPNQT